MYRSTPERTEIALPNVSHADAIWGPTGRDDLGYVYLGVFCDAGERPSATICRIATSGNVARLLGKQNTNLDRIAFVAGQSQQAKIHGIPIQVNDCFTLLPWTKQVRKKMVRLCQRGGTTFGELIHGLTVPTESMSCMFLTL